MPYTEDSKDRPRKDQIKNPKTPGELTLAYTEACLEYINNTKKNYENMARCMAILDPNFPGTGTFFGKIKTPNQLRSKINSITEKYINANTFSEYVLDIRASKICAQHEWYWKMMRPYEDTKCKANGEVYPIFKKGREKNGL